VYRCYVAAIHIICLQSHSVGSTVYRDIFVDDTDSGLAGDVVVSCQNPSSSDDVRNLVFHLLCNTVSRAIGITECYLPPGRGDITTITPLPTGLDVEWCSIIYCERILEIGEHSVKLRAKVV